MINMPSLFHSAALVALAGIALAIPAPEDACFAAVTGKAGNPDEAARKQHCSGFLQYTTTAPPVIAITTSAGPWSPWTPDIGSSPNNVPDWAKACDKDSYKSACKKWNVIETTTTTTPPRTLTTTIYVEDKSTGNPSAPDPWVGSPPTGPAPGSKPGDCSPVTVTITKGDSKPTSGPSPGQGTSGKCLSDEKATEFVNAFKDLLEYTSYNGTQGAPGRGYHFSVSAKYLAPDFQDYSDSINYMAGFPVSSFLMNGIMLTFVARQCHISKQNRFRLWSGYLAT